MQSTLSGDSRESRDKRVSLPEARVSDFEVYLEWLYTSEVVVIGEFDSRGIIFVRLYLLGQDLEDDRFCNAVIDTLLDEHRPGNSEIMIFSPQAIQWIWNRTLPGSILRKILIDFVILDMGGAVHVPRFMPDHTWPREASVEVLARLGEHKEVAGALLSMDLEMIRKAIKATIQHPRTQNKCDYHKHGEDYPRCT